MKMISSTVAGHTQPSLSFTDSPFIFAPLYALAALGTEEDFSSSHLQAAFPITWEKALPSMSRFSQQWDY